MSLRSTPVHPVTLISARIDRAITAGESRFLDAHLDSCPSCQSKEVELSEICAMLEAYPVPAPVPHEVERLLGRLRKLGPPPADSDEPTEAPSAPGRTLQPWMLIVPAVLILIVAGVLIGLPRRPTPPVIDDVRASDKIYPVSMPESDARTCVESPVPPPSRTAPQQAPAAVPAAKPAKEPATGPAADVTSTPLTEVVPPALELLTEPAPSAQPLFATSSVYFSGNGKRLSKEARRTLAEMAQWLRARDEIRLVIEARTDPRKSSGKTLELGRKRALAVARYLEQQGVDPSRLRQEAHENPAAPLPGMDDDRKAGSDRVDLVPGR